MARVKSATARQREALRQSVARERAKLETKPTHATARSNTNSTKLKASVDREVRRVKAGTSALVADSGDVTKGTKVAKKQPKSHIEPKLETGGVSHIGGVIDAAKGIGRVAGRATKDIVTLPVTIAQGTYESVAANVEAAQGDTKRARGLYEGFKGHDPIALAAQGKFKEAGHEISSHPGLFAVEVAGLKGGVGHGATKLAERTGKIPRARMPARDPVTQFAVKRTYSKDAINRGVQRTREQRKVTMVEGMRAKADALEKSGSSSPEIIQLRHHANKIDPRVTNTRQVKIAAARAHDVHKMIGENRGGALDRTLVTAMKSGGDEPSAAHVLHLQRVTDGTPESLKAYRDKLVAKHDAVDAHGAKLLSPDEQAANRAAREQIDKALKSHPTPESMATATKAIEDVLSPLQKRLEQEGILPAARGRKAPLVNYAVTRMEGVRPGKSGPVRDVPLKTDATRTKPVKVKTKEIEQHMAARNVKPGVYISNKRAQTAGGAGATAVSAAKVGSGPRTGRAIVTGGADLDPNVIRRTARVQQRLLDHADAYRANLSQFAADKNMSRADAVKYAKAMQAKHGHEYVAVPRLPFAGSKSIAQLAHSAKDPNSPVSLSTVQEALNHALSGESQVSGLYTVMSKAAADEARALGSLDAFNKGPISTTARAISTAFSRNVLSTSPSWITGNAVEGQVRSVFMGVKPGDSELFKRAVEGVRQIDPYKAEELQAYGAGAGHHGSAGRLEHGHFLAQYDGTLVEPFARKLSAFWEKPTPAKAAETWNAYTDFMFKSVSGRLESNFQSSMSGAIIRKSGLLDPKLPKLSEEAVAQAVQGLINTPEQAALGQALADGFGRYSGRTADAKRFITNYTPFANWSISAAEFVFRVLPRDHPVIVALSSALNNAGRDFYHNDALPPWLRGSIELGGGAHLRISRYLPFGAFTSPSDTLENLVLPQLSGSWAALRGEDWKGKKLYNKDGTPIDEGAKAQLAAQAFLEGVVPFMSRVQNFAAKGPKGTAAATIGYVKPAPAKSGGGSSPASASPWSNYTPSTGTSSTPASASPWSNYSGTP